MNKYPEHPLVELSENLMNSKRHIKVGGKFIDFQLIEVKNSPLHLSDLIPQSEYTILDLWAPWCGPCIRKSKKLKENYQALLERNIKVIGVIGGIDQYAKFEGAKTKYNYPWELYPEVNNEKRIWEKYGVSRGGGGQFLINKKGEILAIDPELAQLFALPEK
ncbi:MAG: TlpA disulfide reductase family protein [Bacteroidota bacterium]